MSGPNGRNSRKLSQDGVTVQQTFSEDEFGVPAVRIELESDREDPADVTLGITLPESESVDRVGFHPEYDPDNWSIDENTLSYKTHLSPDTEVETVYAVQDMASDNGSTLLENLTIQDISTVGGGETQDLDEGHLQSADSAAGDDSESDESPDGESDVDNGSDGQVQSEGEDDAKDRSEGQQRSSVAASVAEAETTRDDTSESEGIADSDGHPDDGSEQTQNEPAPGKSTDTDGPDDGGEANLSAHSDTRLVDELLFRLESGDLSSEYQQQLSDRFGPDEPTSGAGIDQRVSDLQRRVSDVEAFSSSVEAVHDQHGPPADVFEETKTELADVAQRIDGLDERVDTLDAQGDDVESRISGIEADVEDIQSDLAEIEDRLDEAAAERSELEATVTDLIEWREQFVGSLTDLGAE